MAQNSGYYIPGMRAQGQLNILGCDNPNWMVQIGSMTVDVSGSGSVTFEGIGVRSMLDTAYHVFAYNEANGDVVAVRSALKTTSGFSYAGWTGEAVMTVVVIGAAEPGNFQTATV
jgi:hypothetical protein